MRFLSRYRTAVQSVFVRDEKPPLETRKANDAVYVESHYKLCTSWDPFGLLNESEIEVGLHFHLCTSSPAKQQIQHEFLMYFVGLNKSRYVLLREESGFQEFAFSYFNFTLIHANFPIGARRLRSFVQCRFFDRISRPTARFFEKARPISSLGFPCVPRKIFVFFCNKTARVESWVYGEGSFGRSGCPTFVIEVNLLRNLIVGRI